MATYRYLRTALRATSRGPAIAVACGTAQSAKHIEKQTNATPSLGERTGQAMTPIQEDRGLRVVVIVGSVREGRFGAQVGDWVSKHLIESGADAQLIDLADLYFPNSMAIHQDVISFGEAIDRADAIIVVTPEYNHSFSGPLKTAIDALRAQWQAKPVGFVSYGGIARGLRAVEALRLVFAELHAVTVRETVSLHNPWGQADSSHAGWMGQEAANALVTMIRQLEWWADALRAARNRKPYPG